MPLTKSKGNMYPWVTHTHSHLAGKCSHECSYCYVQAMAGRFPVMAERYSGPVRLIESELAVKYGQGRTIFIEHMNDLFAKDVPDGFIGEIRRHCFNYPLNTYVFQSKNPKRMMECSEELPSGSILGTTIESNRDYGVSSAPCVMNRIKAMRKAIWDGKGHKKFITIEPVLDFDVIPLADMIASVNPWFVNLGADSKSRGLPEPTVAKIMQLVDELKKRGIELREKSNLARLKAE